MRTRITSLPLRSRRRGVPPGISRRGSSRASPQPPRPMPSAFGSSGAAPAREGVHVAQHASFLATALLFWWSVLARGRPAAHAMASLFTTMLHTGALGALLTLSPAAWYAAYRTTTTAFGLEPLEDQQ